MVEGQVMFMKLNPEKTALVVGLFTGGMHLVWSLMVAFGFAQMYLDFILGLHFLSIPVTVNPFNIVKALTLVVITGAIGYVGGWLFAMLWNKMHKH